MKLPEEESIEEKQRLSMTPSLGFKMSNTLNSSLKKRKCSTPHQEPEISQSCKKRQISPSILKNQISSEAKNRVLTSVLRISRNPTNSVTKSVKFNASKYTRRITTNEKYEDREEEVNSGEENASAVERKKLFTDDDEAESTEQTICNEEKVQIRPEAEKITDSIVKISESSKFQEDNIESSKNRIEDQQNLIKRKFFFKIRSTCLK